MLRVGEKLQEWAEGARLDEDVDAFGRSAFNRYYYASYLTVRELLGNLNGAWAEQGHGEIPTLLRKAVLRRIRDEAKQRVQGHLLQYAAAQGIQARANKIVAELSGLMEQSYHVRVVADYYPENRIVKEGTKISLENLTLTAAHHRSNKVNDLSKRLLRIWRQELEIG